MKLARTHRSLIQKNTETLKRGLAQMLKGGVIMDVVTADQAKIAEDAGAVAVMALERVPADIRKQGGVSRMTDPKLIKAIMKAVSIPVMAKVRIGHFVEAQILEALGIDYIDESEVLTPADEENHIDKQKFKVPFVCGARDLGEALRRISEGASMIRTKGEAGTGNIVEEVRHIRRINEEIKALSLLSSRPTHHLGRLGGVERSGDFSASPRQRRGSARNDKVKMLQQKTNEMHVPFGLIEWVAHNGKLPVVNFAAGGIANPADAALMMQLGAEGVFVGSGIFKSENPRKRAAAIVQATLHYDNPDIIAKVSEGLGVAMESYEIAKLEALYAERGI